MQKIYHKDMTGDDLHWPKPHATTHMASGSDRVPIFEPVDALPAVASLGQVVYLNTDGFPYYFNGAWNQLSVGGGVIVGPGASTDNAIVRWNGVGGNAVQNSGIIIDDTNNISGIGTINSGAITSTGAIVSAGVITSATTIQGTIITDGTFIATVGAVTAVSYTIGANTLDTIEWANLDGLNQQLDTGQSPQWVNITLSGATIFANAVATGILTFSGIGGANNNNITLDLETINNKVSLSSSSGVNTINCALSWRFNDNLAYDFGSGTDARFTWRTDGIRHMFATGLECGTDDQTGYWFIMNRDDIANVNRRPANNVVDPTIRLYSSNVASAVEYTEWSWDYFTSPGTITAEQLTSTDDIDMTGRLNCNDFINGLYNPSLAGVMAAGNIWNIFYINDDVWGGAVNTTYRFNVATVSMECVVAGITIWSLNALAGILTVTGNIISTGGGITTAGVNVLGGNTTIGTGAAATYTITGNTSASDITITIDGTNDRWQFNDDIWIPAGEKIYFREVGQYITSDGVQRLDLYATTSIDLNSTVYISGNLGISSINPGSAALYILKNALNATANYAGIYSSVTKTLGASVGTSFKAIYSYMDFNDTDASAGEVLGVDAEGRLTLGTVSIGIKGGNIIGRIDGGTDSGYLRGLSAKADANAGTVTGNIENFFDVDIEAGMTAVGGDVNGLRIQVDDDKGAAGTVSLLKLEELTGVDYSILHTGGTAPAKFGGTIATTSADNWDLNDYTAGTVADTGYVTITINGTTYKLLARL